VVAKGIGKGTSRIANNKSGEDWRSIGKMSESVVKSDTLAGRRRSRSDSSLVLKKRKLVDAS
jgi:hypothetical protein